MPTWVRTTAWRKRRNRLPATAPVLGARQAVVTWAQLEVPEPTPPATADPVAPRAGARLATTGAKASSATVAMRAGGRLAQAAAKASSGAASARAQARLRAQAVDAYDFSDLPGLADGFWLRGDDLTGSDGDPITTWEDAGAGNHDATQATGAAKPTLKTGVNGLNGLPAASFDGGDALNTGSIFDSTWDTACTVYVVAKRTANAANVALVSVASANLLLYLGNDDLTTAAVLNDGAHYTRGGLIITSPASAFKRSPPGSRANAGGVGAYRYNGTSELSAWNGEFNAQIGTDVEDGTGNLALSGAARIGQRTDGALSFTGLIAEIIVCKAAHDAATFAETQRRLREKYAIDLPPVLHFSGDSLTHGAGASGDAGRYPSQMLALLDAPHHGYNQGVDSTVIADQDVRRAAMIDPYYAADRDRNTIVMWGGTNNIGAAGTGAAAWTDYQAYCTNARAAAESAGAALKIIGCTLIPRATWNTASKAEAAGFNASLMASSGVVDAKVDLTTSAEFDDPDASHADTTYYSDGTHLTDAGYAVVAARVADAYVALYAADAGTTDAAEPHATARLAASGAKASSTGLSMRAGGRMASAGTRTGAGTATLASGARLAVIGAKGGVGTPTERAGARLATTGAHAGSTTASERGTGILGATGAHTGATSASGRSTGLLASLGIRAASSSAAVRALARLASTATLAFNDVAALLGRGRLSSTAATARTGTASVRADARMASSFATARTSTAAIRARGRLVVVGVSSFGDVTPDFNSPTVAELASSGISTGILAGSGVTAVTDTNDAALAAVLAHDGASEAPLTISGILAATDVNDGATMADDLNDGALTAEVADDGVLEAILR